MPHWLGLVYGGLTVRKLFATPRSLLTGLGLMLVALLVFSAPALAAEAKVESESISGASNTEVTLKAKIEDFGTESTYHFEYGPTASYGAVTPEETLSSEAQVSLEGLPPETAYHFRVVVKNQFGTVYGKDATFATAPSPSLVLPDGRRYEKVSPNNNADGNVKAPTVGSLEDYSARLPFMAAADGNAVTYAGDPSETGGNGRYGTGIGNQYLSRRSPSGGWVTENIEAPTGLLTVVTVYEGFTENLTAGFVTYNGLQPLVSSAPGEKYEVLYKRASSTGAFEPLFTTKPPNRKPAQFGAPNIVEGGGKEYQPAYAGSSADLSHVLFMANDTLTENAVDGGSREENLYDVHDGVLALVNVLPDGSTEPNATFGGPMLVNDRFGDGPSFSHDISEDGRRIFWTDLNNGNLYMREDDTTTIQVDAGVGGGGMFWTATPDGSKALFTKAGDIYEYDVESGQTTRLTTGGEVQGIVGTSEDLSYVYFAANAVLAPGAEHQECVFNESSNEQTTSCNLYVLHRGESTRFIATLSPEDNSSAVPSFREMDGDWQSGMGDRESEATPDGRHLVFVSERSLTGYDNGQAEEVFTYDYGSGRIICVSCKPTGESPTHPRFEPSQAAESAFLPVSHVNTHVTRWMSSDGTKVFFDSVDSLVPQDTNGVNDVYEWEQDGSGGCQRSQGCIYLLSSGSSPESSWLIDASDNGDDVFIVTRSQLTGEDQNENRDVYDVRV